MNSIKAKKVPIDLVLEKMGCPPPMEKPDGWWYKSPDRDEKEPSLKVYKDGNAFKDFGSDHQGNVIDLVMQKHRCDFRQALKQFEEWAMSDSRFIPQGGAVSYKPKKASRQIGLLQERGEGSRSSGKETKEPLIEIYKTKKLENQDLISYLESRKINIEIAKLYLEEAYYYIGEQKKRAFSLFFPNNAGGGELKNQGFTSCLSPKYISLWVNSNSAPLLAKKEKWAVWRKENPENCKSVLVFEAPLDFLSALTHKNKTVSDTPVMVLNSSNMSKEAVIFIKDYGFETIYYLGDNDEAGESALKVLRENLDGVEIKDSRWLYKDFKDFNEFLMKSET